jgi:hypothetical protein
LGSVASDISAPFYNSKQLSDVSRAQERHEPDSKIGASDWAASGSLMQAAPPSWLNLAQLGLYRDLRKLVYAKLEAYDRALVKAAHLHTPVKLDGRFAAFCAGRGHLALLQWAREQGCSWNEGSCRQAARGGHVAMLRWLREQGCPWDEETCSAAAAGGHL